MAKQTEIRQRGRPSAFPEGVDTRMAGFRLPTETLDMLRGCTERRNAKRADGTSPVTQNQIVDRALRAYCQERKAKPSATA